MFTLVAGVQSVVAEQPTALKGFQRSAVGVTRTGTEIACWLSPDDFALGTSKTRVLLIGGMDGKRASVDATLLALKRFSDGKLPRDVGRSIALSAVPNINPDGIAAGKGPANTVGGDPSRGYPPQGAAYNSTTDPEAAYLWRWIGMAAPDLVVEVRAGKSLRWFHSKGSDANFVKLAQAIKSVELREMTDQLVTQLAQVAPCETGTVPAIRVEVPPDEKGFLTALCGAIEASQFSGPSPARRALQKRLERTPVELAKELSRYYGHDLNQVVYIPALALVARIRLGELMGDVAHLKDVERIVAPYYFGKKSAAAKSGSGLSGHLIFAELARVTEGERRARYLELARGAADLAFHENGNPRNSMPYHNEMSDSVFMGGPILSRVGKLAGDPRYFDACVRHIRFMRKLVLREDGLYRHSPLDEAAWGRGNGFPALGMAMCLTDIPQNYPGREEMLDAYRSHLAALLRHQDPTGCWHQIIDKPGSYRELTSTCMIAFAMIRGIRTGWLDRERYEPAVRRAFSAVLTRIGPEGRLVDVCTGTGKQKNLRAYYDRTAILGRDARGGAMALLVATEMARWERELRREP